MAVSIVTISTMAVPSVTETGVVVALKKGAKFPKC